MEEVTTAEDVIRRIMGAHWDIFACNCWVCYGGRRLGLAPEERWLSSHNDNDKKMPVPFEGWGDKDCQPSTT